MKLPSTEQTDFAATVEALLEKRDPLEPMRHRTGARALDRGLWDELVTTGLLEPADAGDVLTACLVGEALGRRAAPLPYLAATLGAALVTAGGGTPTGLTTFGLLAADGDWTTMVEQGDGTVTGVLPFVPDADCADAVVVRAAGSDRLAVVQLADATVTELACTDGTQPLARVVCDATPAALLPDPVDLDRVRDLAIALHCASLLGVMTWLLDTTVEYAGHRVQFGMPIAARQAVKHRCASMLIQVESCRAMVLELADALEEDGAERALTAATAMSWTAEAAEEVAGGALQLHGGIGFTWEHDLHHYFKRCTVGAMLLGTSGAHRGRVAELLGAAGH